MRISDWSSDVCSSDLLWLGGMALLLLLDLTRRIFGWPLVIVCGLTLVYGLYGHHLPWIFRHAGFPYYETLRTVWYSFDGVFGGPVAVEIGRASWRERVCQYV